MRSIIVAALLVGAFSLTTFSQTFNADIVVVNANVHTGNKAQPKARAIAVSGNKIIAVGDDAQIRALAGPKTRVIDAGGKTVVAGFNDAHVHFMETGYQLSSVDLRNAKTPQEFVARIKAFAA
nr:amidohydrolase family protein [Pyrinomonadaceae bacterium]